jgi:hypothetical protein
MTKATVPCPLGQACPTTSGKNHRAGSKELKEHEKMSKSGETRKGRDSLKPHDRRTDASPREAPPVATMRFPELSDFIRKADVSVDQVDGGDVVVIRGDIGISVSLTQGDAEAMAGSQVGSDNFELDLLVGMNSAREMSNEDINVKSAFVVTTLPADEGYRWPTKDYLDSFDSAVSIRKAAYDAGRSRTHVKNIVEGYRESSDATHLRSDNYTCERIGQDVSLTLRLGSPSVNGEWVEFPYMNKLGEEEVVAAKRDVAYGSEQTPYEILGRAAIDMADAHDDKDGLEAVVRLRNYIEGDSEKAFHECVEHAIDTRADLKYRKFLSERLLGKVEN